MQPINVNNTLFTLLIGLIPQSIGLLVHLESLCLNGNKLEGEIPKNFKNLQQLVVLRLEGNNLTGNA